MLSGLASLNRPSSSMGRIRTAFRGPFLVGLEFAETAKMPGSIRSPCAQNHCGRYLLLSTD